MYSDSHTCDNIPAPTLNANEIACLCKSHLRRIPQIV